MKGIYKNPLFWPIIIFSIAAIFRIFYLDLIEFKADEALTLLQVNNFYENPYIIQFGLQSSMGIKNFPIFHYLIILFSPLSRSPQFTSFIIALINSGLLVFFYLIVKKFYGKSIGVFSSLLLATSPWAILFSRKIWAQDLIFIFLLPFFYFLNDIFKNKNKKSFLYLFFMLSFLIQLHGSGVFLTISTIIIFFITKTKINFKYSAIGFFSGFIVAIPYFFYQISTSCSDCSRFLFYQSDPYKIFDFFNFIRPFQLINGLFFEFELGKAIQIFINESLILKLINYLFFLELFIPIFALVIIIKNQKKYMFLILYLLLTSLFYFLTKTPSYPHYFIILLPMIALIYTLPIDFLYHKKKTKILSIIIFLIIISSNLIFESNFYSFLSKNVKTNGDYGAIFKVNNIVVDNTIKDYFLLPYYQELKFYSYIYADPKIINSKLGDYFASKNNPALAMKEFEKALVINSKDILSREKLAYLYIVSNKNNDAINQIKIIGKIDSTGAAKLKELLNKK